MPLEGGAPLAGEPDLHPPATAGGRTLDCDVAGPLEGAELLGQRGSDRSRRSRTKAKSIQSAEASSATIDSRVLGWMISSNRGAVTSVRRARPRRRTPAIIVGPPAPTATATTTLAIVAG